MFVPVNVPRVFAATAIAAVCCVATSAQAYFGAAWVRHDIRGDFDDQSALVGADAVYDLPTIDPGTGVRYCFGGGRDARIELSYAITHHSAPGDLRPDGYATRYQVYALDLAFNTGIARKLTKDHARVILRFGGALTRLKLAESGYDINLETFDATYSGGGFTAGAGLEFVLPGGFQPHIDYSYNLTGYSSVNARDDSIDIKDRVSGKGPSLVAGFTWRP